MNTCSKHFILLVSTILVGCASHPQQTTQSQRAMIPLPIVATYPNSPTFQNLMAILRDHGIHCTSHISGRTGKITMCVYPEESAKAKEILSSLASEDNFKGLEVVK